jgi:hypothetical protein
LTGNSAQGAGLSSQQSDACATGQDKDWLTIPCGGNRLGNIENTQAGTFCPDRFCGTVLNAQTGQNFAGNIYSK